MATSGKFLGTIVSLYVNNEKVANAMAHDFNLATDLIETTTKDSNGFKEYLPGEHGGTITIEGLMEQQSSLGGSVVSPEDLMDFQLNRTAIAVKLTTDVAADLCFVGSGFLSNTALSFPKNDVATFSADFTFSGAITLANES